jgi:ABC-type glutathione transport system ATPase component
MDLPTGCRFASRCPSCRAALPDAYPATVRVGEEHTADCWKVAVAVTTVPLLRVEGLRKYSPSPRASCSRAPLGHVKAVDDVSFDIRAGQTLGLVGESGCGKTTTSRMILNLEEPTEGRILLEDEPIHGLQGEALAPIAPRCRRCSRIRGRRSIRA